MWGNTKKCKQVSLKSGGLHKYNPSVYKCYVSKCSEICFQSRISHTYVKEGDLYGHVSY